MRYVMHAGEIASEAAKLVAGDRNRVHGPKNANFQNIADLWNAFLGEKLCTGITSAEVGLMMVLSKVARTKTGEFNLDDYIDAAGYAACAGEIAARRSSEV